jgi:hypothetical protein
LQKRFCVFCGERPESKNREHVIPAWLIALTGDKNREVGIGLDLTTRPFSERRFSFNSFAFPACEACNSAFAELESKAKGVVETILSRGRLAAGDWDVFLDWLDKVRVGLWLAGIYLNKNYQAVSPNFHIEKRVGSSDRLVVVYELEADGWQGVVWAGTDSPVFHVMPSCMCLTINDFCFVSVSYDFLFAERLGLPFPTARRLRADRRQVVDLVAGSEHAVLPLVDFKFPFGGSSLFQPMIPWGMLAPTSDGDPLRFYDTVFARDLCTDYEDGKGKVVIQTRGRLVEYSEAPSSEWLPPVPVPRVKTVYSAVLGVHAVLQSLYAAQPSLGEIPEDERGKLQQMIDVRLEANQALMTNIEKQIRALR